MVKIVREFRFPAAPGGVTMNHFDINEVKDLDDFILQVAGPEDDEEDEEDGYYPMLISAA
jgi:hypothetical protein